MNLQELNKLEQAPGEPKEWRNSHTIRFSQIDGAGIVYYPRYFEMLADSFPQPFSIRSPTTLDLTFHQPARLGEKLDLVPANHESEGRFSVEGMAGDRLCFEAHRTGLDLARPAVLTEAGYTFVRQLQIADWMCGADSRLHLSRCYELTAVLMEEWFSVALHCPFATLQSADGALVPTVRLQSDFHELPLSMDWVQASLSVLQIGRSSLQMVMEVSRNGQLLLQTRQTVVFVSYQDDQLASVEIPPAVRERLKQQQGMVKP